MSDDTAKIGMARPAIWSSQALILLIVAGYPFAFGTAIYLADWEDWGWYAWGPVSLGVLSAAPLTHFGWRRLLSRPEKVLAPPSLAVAPA